MLANGKSLLIERGGHPVAEGLRIETWDTRDHAVGGQNQQAFAAGIEKRHHHFFVGCVKVAVRSAGSTLIAVGNGGFVAMVTVGDDQFAIRHGLPDASDHAGIENGPEAMHNVVFVARLDWRGGRSCRSQQLIHAPVRVGVQHEKLAGVRAGMTQ